MKEGRTKGVGPHLVTEGRSLLLEPESAGFERLLFISRPLAQLAEFGACVLDVPCECLDALALLDLHAVDDRLQRGEELRLTLALSHVRGVLLLETGLGSDRVAKKTGRMGCVRTFQG